jgi:Nucleotidyl transferase AbiEii toxin, Type IV TA system
MTPRRYETIAAFESALRAKLHSVADERRTFQDLRRQVAFGRVLARLQLVAPNAWLLKGGAALEYRIERARATLDLDISTQLEIERMSELLAASAAVTIDDYFQIVLGERERPVDGIETYRFSVDVEYANGRRFEKLKLDIGFGDPLIGTPVEIEVPSLLDFAGVPAVLVKAIPAEQQLAEKVHAYTKPYGPHRSSRVKDLVDMALLLRSGADVDELRNSLQIVFTKRATHEIPTMLPRPPEGWRVPYARLATDLPVPADLNAGYEFVAGGLLAALTRL